MNDKLFEAFRIYQLEGLIGLNEEQALEAVKDYNPEKRNAALTAYRVVTMDPILGPMIPELPSYDLNNVSIKDLYGERKRQIEQASMTQPTQTEVAPSQEAPVEVTPTPEDPTSSFVEGAKALQEKIAKNPEEIANNPAIEPEPAPVVEQELPEQNLGIQQKNNLAMKKKLTNTRINQTGYANIVLMSIIILIIAAIVCVFIFM